MPLCLVTVNFGMSDVILQLVGKRVYFDVNLFIYALEPTQDMQAYFVTVTKLFEMAVAKQFNAITSKQPR